MKNVTIYSTSTCHYCHAAKEFFAKNNIAYTNYDVGEDAVRRNEMLEKSGQMGVPVIIIDNEMIIGFDESQVKKSLSIA